MNQDKQYSLAEIEKRLKEQAFPFRGVTELGSARFIFDRPANCAGMAIHTASRIREELLDALKVSEKSRYREEDPFTELFIAALPIQVIALDSRFEYDLNRSRERAIPLTPEMAWGLEVWKRPLTENEKEQSLAKYDEFHSLIDLLSAYLVSGGKKAYIFDLHSYCYQRDERLPWYEDSKPEINLGSEAINGQVFDADLKWLLKRFGGLSAAGRKIRAAENEVFKGGYLARKLCARHHESLAVFAIELKKIFMDEWTGEVNKSLLEELTGQFSCLVDQFMQRVG